jgi:hypothetical protein
MSKSLEALLFCRALSDFNCVKTSSNCLKIYEFKFHLRIENHYTKNILLYCNGVVNGLNMKINYIQSQNEHLRYSEKPENKTPKQMLGCFYLRTQLFATAKKRPSILCLVFFPSVATLRYSEELNSNKILWILFECFPCLVACMKQLMCLV